jgi:hypothetical protein
MYTIKNAKNTIAAVYRNFDLFMTINEIALALATEYSREPPSRYKLHMTSVDLPSGAVTQGEDKHGDDKELVGVTQNDK